MKSSTVSSVHNSRLSLCGDSRGCHGDSQVKRRTEKEKEYVPTPVCFFNTDDVSRFYFTKSEDMDVK